jgi:hypothetical protein
MEQTGNRETGIFSQEARYATKHTIVLLATALKNLCMVSTPLFSHNDALIFSLRGNDVAKNYLTPDGFSVHLPREAFQCCKDIDFICHHLQEMERQRDIHTDITETPEALERQVARPYFWVLQGVCNLQVLPLFWQREKKAIYFV